MDGPNEGPEPGVPYSGGKERGRRWAEKRGIESGKEDGPTTEPEVRQRGRRQAAVHAGSRGKG